MASAPFKSGSRLNLNRFTLSVCAIAALLPGCGGGRGVAPQTDSVALPTVLQQQSHELASGGAFIAGYTGTAKQTHRRGTRQILFYNGEGNASFIGRSEEHGTFQLYCQPTCGFVKGKFWLISRRHPQNIVIMSVKINKVGSSYVYRVTGGVGKFAKATGMGTWSNPDFGKKRSYSDQWSGTLYY
jgi:hypothetical protein